MYRFIRPMLFKLPSEAAHHLGFGSLKTLAAMPFGSSAIRALFANHPPELGCRVFGRDFPTPIGLAAGFDKNAEGIRALGAAGFGFLEVGTLTGTGQAGNPKPRLFRLPQDAALINRMGFNNGGSESAIKRLQKPRDCIVGVNIGKTKTVPAEEAIADYILSTRRVAPHADYLVVNVSSPNTPGLRDLQAVSQLRPLLLAVQAAMAECDALIPLLVKISPDLADGDIEEIARMALELQLDGIIATNTTTSRAGLQTSTTEIDGIGAGGLSGAPLTHRSYQVLRLLREVVGDGLALVSVGGIATGGEVYRRLLCGASLTQIYSAYIYGGPNLLSQMGHELLSALRAGGYSTVQDLLDRR